VYLAVVALTPITLAAHRHGGWWAVVLLAVSASILDVGRFTLGVEALGYPNVILVWVLAHQLGYLYADRRLGRREAAALAVVGVVPLSLLVAFGPYPASMVGTPRDEISNMYPPNLAIVALALWQIGVAVLVRPPQGRGNG
jgi:hypothetical protein